MAFYQKASFLVEIFWISTYFSTELPPVPCYWCTDSGKKIHVVAAALCVSLCVRKWDLCNKGSADVCCAMMELLRNMRQADMSANTYYVGHQCRRHDPWTFHLLVEIVWILADFSQAFSLIHTFIL
jgi:hypothetical protein